MGVSEFERVADILRQLQVKPPNVFGAKAHGFRLNPPLAEDAIEDFERQHSIRLPSDFREFISKIGDGGAGPFYGIFPLGVVDEGFGFRNWHEPDGLVGLLSEPFRFREEWNDLSSMPLPDLAELDEGEYDRRLEQFEKTYWSDELVNGAMPICHEGCAMRILLALTGTQAGNLWEDRRSEYGVLRPVLLSDGSKARFGSWYLEWLDACLASAKS